MLLSHLGRQFIWSKNMGIWRYLKINRKYRYFQRPPGPADGPTETGRGLKTALAGSHYYYGDPADRPCLKQKSRIYHLPNLKKRVIMDLFERMTIQFKPASFPIRFLLSLRWIFVSTFALYLDCAASAPADI